MSGDPKPAATLCCAPAVLPLVPGFARPPAERRPLPDAVAVRMLAIPDSAPPYDDELGTGRLPCLADGEPVQRRHEPGGRPLPAGQPSRRQAADGPEANRPETDRPETDRQVADGPETDWQETDQRVAPAGQPPAPRPARAGSPGRGPAAQPGWPSQFAQVLAETLAGSRPQRQIAPWTTERARRHIQRLGPLLAAGEQPRVRRVVTFRPAADVVEMSVIVGVGPKVRALAIRLERDGPRDAAPGRTALAARWVCTAVEAA